MDDADRLGHPEMLVDDVLDHLHDMTKKLIKKYDQLWDEARANEASKKIHSPQPSEQASVLTLTPQDVVVFLRTAV